jgi:quercetin dioxygenase-like cupin family protein
VPDRPDTSIVKRTAKMPWRDTDMPGVQWKPLRYVAESGAGAVLLRMSPGCAYPPHQHEAGEHVYVLEGELIIGPEHYGPGDYLYSPPGSIHAPRTESGCVLFGTFPGHVRNRPESPSPLVPPPPAPGDPAGTPGTGDVLAGRWVLGEPLGAGGMAEVYAATDRRSGEEVAVKLLPHTPADHGGWNRWVANEAEALRRLQDLCVVKLHAWGSHGETAFLVMERLVGESLREVIQRDGRCELEWVTTVLHSAAVALQSVHALGVVHRDIKPDNLWIPAAQGEQTTPFVKLFDFGVAYIHEADLDDPMYMDIAAPILGAPPYMSPEQLDGRPLTWATDCWSLGVVGYEMCSGRRPFRGESAHQIFYSILKDTPPPLRELAPATPAAVVSVIERALAKEPTDRFGSMAEFAAALPSREI